MRVIQLRRADACVACGRALGAGERAGWDPGARACTCLACLDGVQQDVELTFNAGQAGGSAARTHERLSERHRHEQERKVAEDRARRARAKTEHPVLGRIANLVVPPERVEPEPAHVRSWGVGAPGEVRVGEVLDNIEGIVAIHDRKVGKANIDHVAVTPAAVWIIDSKRYPDARVEFRDVGGWFRTDERLIVAGRDRSKLVDGLSWQIDAVRKVVPDTEIPVRGMLCFVESTWGWFAKPFTVRQVAIAWPSALPELLQRPGPLDRGTIEGLARVIATSLPAATG